MSRWWTRELASEEDPITLEPLRKLKHPPFECKADPSLSHRTGSDWFDGHALACYLIATANFLHPISRRPLTRAECEALDRHCVEHRLGSPHVLKIFDCAQQAPGEPNVAQLRAEAETVLVSLFGGGGGGEESRQSAARHHAAVVSEGGLSMVDDDLVPSHAACDTSSAERVGEPAEAFPALHDAAPTSTAPQWTTGGQHMRPPLPSAPPSAADVAAAAAAAARERAARERLAQERRAWVAAAAAAAEARDAAAREAAAAAAAESAAFEQAQWRQWEDAASREAATTAALAEVSDAEARRRADEEERRLHDAAAAGEAELVWQLLEEGHDPTRRRADIHGGRVPYEVASSVEVRNAMRRFRGERPRGWDWAAALVPSAASEEEEARQAEEAAQAAREKKRHAEKARKERRRAEEEAKGAALEALQRAVGATAYDAATADDAEDDVAELEARLEEAMRLGCTVEETAAATERLAQLKDPAAQRRRERERARAEAERRLGSLTERQAQLIMRGSGGSAVGPAASPAPAPAPAPASAATPARVPETVRPVAAAPSVVLDLDDADIYDEPAAAAPVSESPLWTVTLVYKGRSEATSVRGHEPLSALFAAAAAAFDLPLEKHSLKLILKGKALQPEAVAADVLGTCAASPKIMVMASAREAVEAAQDSVAAAAADKSVASFAAEHGGKRGRVPTAKGVRQASLGKR